MNSSSSEMADHQFAGVLVQDNHFRLVITRTKPEPYNDVT